LQSFREHDASTWVRRCLSSVQDWCDYQGYTYAFAGDELFARLPPWYAEKVAGRNPIAADLARLLWIEQQLRETGAHTVIWLDADVFVMAGDQLEVALNTSCAFGYEYWLQPHTNKPGYKIHKNVHNAYCAFRQGCPILPFLIEAIQRMVRKVDARAMAPQFVGPKLLTHLHNTIGFEVDARFGSISPEFADALLQNNSAALKLVSQHLKDPMLAANLCASLHATDDQRMDELLDLLGSFKSGLK